MDDIERMVMDRAKENGFVVKDRRPNGQIIFYRESPAASASLHLEDGEHAKLRSIGELDRWLAKIFDK
jgi:hypothetical protein